MEECVSPPRRLFSKPALRSARSEPYLPDICVPISLCRGHGQVATNSSSAHFTPDCDCTCIPRDELFIYTPTLHSSSTYSTGSYAPTSTSPSRRYSNQLYTPTPPCTNLYLSDQSVSCCDVTRLHLNDRDQLYSPTPSSRTSSSTSHKTVTFSDNVNVISTEEETAQPTMDYMTYVQQLIINCRRRKMENLDKDTSNSRQHLNRTNNVCILCHQTNVIPASEYCHNCASYLARIQNS